MGASVPSREMVCFVSGHMRCLLISILTIPIPNLAHEICVTSDRTGEALTVRSLALSKIGVCCRSLSSVG
eukprot:6179579-Pleurochrysis_carterae.AAC.2